MSLPPVSSTAIKVRLLIDKKEVPVQSLQASFTADGLHACVCQLAVGSLGTAHGAELTQLYFEFGTPAEVIVEVTDWSTIGAVQYVPPQGPFVLFRGVVSHGGPGKVSGDSFSVEVQLTGRLTGLADGTLQNSSFVAGSLSDFTIPAGQMLNDKQLFFPLTEFLDSPGETFISGLRQVSRQNAAWPLTESGLALFATFGMSTATSQDGTDLNRINAGADALLATIKSTLIWRGGVVDSIRQNIAQVLEQAMMFDYRVSSFLNRLQGVGQLLGFRALETPGGIQLVPFSPFTIASDCKVILPSTYSSVSTSAQDARRFRGLALGSARGGVVSSLWAGIYARPGFTVGVIPVLDAPPYLGSVGGEITQGQDVPSDQESLPVITKEVRDSLGDHVAREMCLTMAYQSRTCQVNCPYLRTDLGPLTPVAIRYPDVPGAPNSPSVYGVIQQVTIQIDAQASVAATTLQVGYARTANHQLAEIDHVADSHPLWAANYIGGRLDTESA